MQNSHNFINPSSSTMSPPDFYNTTNSPAPLNLSYAQFGRSPFFGSSYNFNSPATSSYSSIPTICTSTYSSNILIPSPPKCNCKRKSESPLSTRAKQRITEERIAREMSELHISSRTPQIPIENQTLRERRLYMCSEMQRLQNEEIIPAQILESINQPCTALVPWIPPMIPLNLETNNNNNEEGSRDNNVMDLDS